ncbi:MAG TPA: hypothetical protein IAB01_00810 [Candidatus Avidesulfovibrio excrementigallinarum]|nr:hypothetical protein [Candidatus Avidesulfovibrio excrementigallinarum]
MPAVRVIVLQDTYRDSVYLMKLSSQAKAECGALQVSAMMGTARNKELFASSGLSTPEVVAAKPDDLVIAVEIEPERAEQALETVRRLLDEAPAKSAGVAEAARPATLEEALKEDKTLNMALISVAGDYARYEAARALSAGMDVMLYSDNISLEDEIALKRLARAKNALVMGPDCGTAIIDGVPLAFANVVRRGPVGVVGASGTGVQEVVCLLDRFGVGISQAYGTGGRDLKDAVGGMTALAALDRLKADPATKVVVVLGKTPGEATRGALAERFRAMGKPVFVSYLGTSEYAPELAAGAVAADTLTALAGSVAQFVQPGLDTESVLAAGEPVLPSRPGLLRGLFGGGTLCQEAAEIAAPLLEGDKYSNLRLDGFGHLSGREASRGHCFWDFGDDEFTVGRPHPMMAPELKMEHLVHELCDPAVSVVLMDMVLGYGSSDRQSALLTEALAEARARSGGRSEEVLIVASVCGTDGDKPGRAAEVQVLREAGIFVFGSNARAAAHAARASRGGR